MALLAPQGRENTGLILAGRAEFGYYLKVMRFPSSKMSGREQHK